MFKKLLIVLIGTAVVLAVVGLLLPRKAHVERSVDIDRPASLIFATVDSFQLFPRWSPWQDLDPHMRQSTDGPRDGVGATLRWTGNGKVGTGTQVITAATPDRSVSSDVDFGNMGLAQSTVILTPNASKTSTRVTWTMDIDMGAGPLGHYFGLLMDRMVGKDYETGLGKLKTLVEGMPNVDIAGFNAETVDLKAMPVLLVAEKSAPDTPSISKAYADGYGRIAKFMARNKLHQAGAPLGIDGDMTPTSFTFQAAIPIDRTDVAAADDVAVAQSYAGKALKVMHVGPYDTLGAAYQAYPAYMAAHGYTSAGNSIARYIDDPGSVAADKLRTEIYWPIR